MGLNLMNRFAFVLTGLLLSTSVLAGKPPPVQCPCDFDSLYADSIGSYTYSCFLQSYSAHGHHKVDSLEWEVSDGSYTLDLHILADQTGNERGCLDNELAITALSPKEYAACVDAVKLIADDASSTLPDCP